MKINFHILVIILIVFFQNCNAAEFDYEDSADEFTDEREIRLIILDDNQYGALGINCEKNSLTFIGGFMNSFISDDRIKVKIRGLYTY